MQRKPEAVGAESKFKLLFIDFGKFIMHIIKLKKYCQKLVVVKAKKTT